MAQVTDKEQTTSSGYKYKLEELGKSKVKLTIEIESGKFKKEEEKAFRELSKDIKIQGFRPGKAPEAMLRAQLGAAPYEQALNNLLPKATVEVVNDLTIKQGRSFTPIDQVHYELAKVQPASGVTFSATFSIFPKVEIGDLKSVKVTKQSVEVDDSEVEKVIQNMFEDWQKEQEATKNKKEEEKKEEDDKTNSDDTKDKKQEKTFDKPSDEWVKELDVSANTLEELRKVVKEEIEKQKTAQVKDKLNEDMVKAALEVSEVEIPESFVNTELDHEEDRYKSRIENIGMSVEEFLKKQNTTMEQLRKSWRPNIEERIKVDLFLLEFARENNIKVGKEEIDAEISSIPDEETRKLYDNEEGRRYISDIKLRQKTLKKLEEVITIEEETMDKDSSDEKK